MRFRCQIDLFLVDCFLPKRRASSLTGKINPNNTRINLYAGSPPRSEHVVSFPIRVKWKNEDGKVVTEEGLTENVGVNGALIYLPRLLPTVGCKVDLTVTENTKEEVTVGGQVIRLERNAAHPQVALTLTDGMRTWKKKFGISQLKPSPARSRKSWMTGKL